MGTTNGLECVFPFIYDETTFYSCTTAGGFPSWRYTEVDGNGKGVNGKFADCTTDAACSAGSDTECVTTAGPVTGAACVFPFLFGGETFNGCTTAGGFDPWCYTMVDADGVGVKGRYGDCPNPLSDVCTAPTTTSAADTTAAADTTTAAETTAAETTAAEDTTAAETTAAETTVADTTTAETTAAETTAAETTAAETTEAETTAAADTTTTAAETTAA